MVQELIIVPTFKYALAIKPEAGGHEKEGKGAETQKQIPSSENVPPPLPITKAPTN